MSELLSALEYRERYERALVDLLRARTELRRVSRKQAVLRREIKSLREATSDTRHKQLRNAAKHYKAALGKIVYSPHPGDPVEIAREALSKQYADLLGDEGGLAMTREKERG